MKWKLKKTKLGQHIFYKELSENNRFLISKPAICQTIKNYGSQFFLFLNLILFTASTLAVEPLFNTPEDMDPTWVDNLLNVFGADGGFDDSKAIDMSYLPTAYYTPEKKFGVGLLVVGLYKTDSATSEEQPSSLVINSFVSMNKSYGVTVENMNFFNQGQERLLLDVDLHNEASVYYGKGISKGDVDSNQYTFEEQVYSFKPRWMTEVAEDYFIGIGGDLISASAENLEYTKANTKYDSDSILPTNFSSGIVITSVYDSRDYRLNATKGWLFQVDAGLYHNDQQDSFSTYNFELANYIELGTAPGLIAWQMQGHFTSGDVPWNLMPDLGGSSAMRGYIKGRYRDDQMAMGQVEYRLPIFQRYGMVFWVAAGSVASSVEKLNDDILMSYGTGFRFRIKDNINLRADIGVGENDTNFYLNVNEVF